MHRRTKLDAASPVDVSVAGSNAAGTTSHTAPAVTTTGVNRMAVTVVAPAVVASLTPPAGSTERADQSGGAGAPTVSVETSDVLKRPYALKLG
jgi:hypothetical protein